MKDLTGGHEMIWRLCEACNTIHVEDEWINPHIWPINGTVLDGATCPGCLSTRYVDTGEILLTDVIACEVDGGEPISCESCCAVRAENEAAIRKDRIPAYADTCGECA